MSEAKLRVGMIGAGGIAGVHVDGWLAHGAEVRVFSKDGAGVFAALHDIEAVGAIDDLWGWADVVDIVTPTPSHAGLALTAIAHGVHVVCEKPLARTSAEARKVVSAARDAGVLLFPAHVVRYFPEYVAARDAVHAGRIGELAICRFQRQSAAPVADWFFDEAISGGIIMDQMIHDLDQAEWIAGPVTSLFAQATPDIGTRRVGSAQITLQHESGAISYVQGVWGGESLPFSSAFQLAGSTGVLRYDSARNDTLRRAVPDADAGGYVASFATAESPYTHEIGDVIAALRGKREARVSPAAGLRAVELAEAAALSVATGQPVALDEGVLA